MKLVRLTLAGLLFGVCGMGGGALTASPVLQDDPEEVAKNQKRVAEALKRIREKIDVLIEQLEKKSPYYAEKLKEARKRLSKYSPEVKIDRILNHLEKNRVEKAIKDGEEVASMLESLLALLEDRTDLKELEKQKQILE